VDLLAAPTTRVVLLDVMATPAAATGSPDLVGELGRDYLVPALARRRSAGHTAFSVLAHDASSAAGDRTRDLERQLSRSVDPELGGWLAGQGAFPGSVVDDVLPGPDGRPRWFVEDVFGDEPPPLEQVGGCLVPSTAGHERLRTRLLGGARCALSWVTSPSDAATSDEALADPELFEFLRGFLQEAAASVLCVPGVDVDEYRVAVLELLATPRTGEPLSELRRNGAETVSTCVLPSLRSATDHYTPRRHLVLAVAAWLRALPAGAPGEPPADARRLVQEQRTVFGTLADDAHLVAELQEALELLRAGTLSPAAPSEVAS
jgi:mannitol-1-phosphate/altronate dehydrogenase